MTQSSQTPEWIGLLRHGSGTTSGWGFSARRVIASATAPQGAADTVPRALGGDAQTPVIGVDDSHYALAPLPAAICPDAADLARHRGLSALEQRSPAALLLPSSRLRIAGFLALNKEWDGVVLDVQSDRSHWVHLSAGEAVSMMSFLTPMLAANLGAALGEAPLDTEALARSQARPEALAAHLSSAELEGDDGAVVGHLLGAELSASKPYWLGQQLALIAAPAAAAPYCAALAAQGLMVTQTDPAAMTQNGFIALKEALGAAR